MKATLVALAVLAAGTSARSLPSCADRCMSTAVAKTPCDASDIKCLCESREFLRSINYCSGKACSKAERTTAINAVTSLCSKLGGEATEGEHGNAGALNGDASDILKVQRVELRKRGDIPSSEHAKQLRRDIYQGQGQLSRLQEQKQQADVKLAKQQARQQRLKQQFDVLKKRSTDAESSKDADSQQSSKTLEQKTATQKTRVLATKAQSAALAGQIKELKDQMRSWENTLRGYSEVQPTSSWYSPQPQGSIVPEGNGTPAPAAITALFYPGQAQGTYVPVPASNGGSNGIRPVSVAPAAQTFYQPPAQGTYVPAPPVFYAGPPSHSAMPNVVQPGPTPHPTSSWYLPPAQGSVIPYANNNNPKPSPTTTQGFYVAPAQTSYKPEFYAPPVQSSYKPEFYAPPAQTSYKP